MTRSRDSCTARPKETTVEVTLEVDGTGHDDGRDRHPVLRPHARAARQARRLRPHDRGARAISRSTCTTPSRTSASCSATRCAKRSATRPACAASRTRSCRSTRRSCRSRSTSRAGRSSSTRSTRSSEWIGTFDPQLAEEFWKGFVDGARVTLHMRSVSGKNGHHVIEASFKGVARALRDAVRVEGDGRARRPRARLSSVTIVASSTTGSATCGRRRRRLQHLGADAVLTADADEIARRRRGRAARVSAAFGACMRALRRRGLEAVTKEAATDGRPFLGVCVGMQMLFDGSDESPDVAGLGVVAGRVTRLPGHRAAAADRLEHARGHGRAVALVRRARRRRVALLRALVRARTGRRRGRRRVVRVRPPLRGRDRAGPVWATQFHPEKSGAVGLRLLQNFVDGRG